MTGSFFFFYTCDEKVGVETPRAAVVVRLAVLLDSANFSALLEFIGIAILPSFTWFYLVLSSFTYFYLVLSSFYIDITILPSFTLFT